MSETVNFHPNWISSPGDTIADILVEQHISVGLFAKKINRSQEYVKGLLDGFHSINTDIARDLELVLGVSCDFWLNREYQYRQDLERVAKLQNELWLKELPIKDMIKLGWIPSSDNIFQECLKFFGIETVKDWKLKYEKIVSITAFRKSNTFKSEYGAMTAWLRQGEIIGSKIKCNVWSPDLFGNSLEKIKQLTRKKSPKDFLPELTRLCSECGVALAIVKTPAGCRASGATKFVEKEKALIMLSFRHLSDDQFWFTFFHEAGHLLLHGDKATTIEGLPEIDDLTKESEANSFAGELLIPHVLHQQLSKIRGNKRDIINFAIQAGVSPGIVVGQLQFHGFIDKKYLNSYKRRYSWEEII